MGSKNLETNKISKIEIFANIFFGLIIFLLSAFFILILLKFSRFKINYVMISCLVILILNVLIIMVLKLNAKIKGILAIIVCSIIVIGLFVESMLPIDPIVPIGPFRPIFVEGKFPKLTDQRSKYQIVKYLRSKNININFSFEPSYLLEKKSEIAAKSFRIGDKSILPLANISNSKIIFDKESGEWQYFESDEHGFNNPTGLYKSGQLDFVIMGGSYAQGMGVKQRESIAGVIREKYKNTLSLGTHGIGPLSMLAIFSEYVEPLRPKNIIWFYYEGSEIANLLWELQQPQLVAYLNPRYSQNLINYQSQIDQMLINWFEQQEKVVVKRKKDKDKLGFKDWIERIRKTLTLARTRVLLGIQFDKKDYVIPCPPRCHLLPSGEPNQEFLTILKQVKNRAESWGGKLYFVSIPTRKRVKEGVINPKYNYLSYRDGQLSGVESLQINMIDLYPNLVSHADTMSLYRYRRWGHFNPKGYRFVANAILDSIEGMR